MRRLQAHPWAQAEAGMPDDEGSLEEDTKMYHQCKTTLNTGQTSVSVSIMIKPGAGCWG